MSKIVRPQKIAAHHQKFKTLLQRKIRKNNLRGTIASPTTRLSN